MSYHESYMYLSCDDPWDGMMSWPLARGKRARKSTPTKPKGVGVGPEECPMSSAANFVAVITGAEIAGDLVGMMYT